MKQLTLMLLITQFFFTAPAFAENSNTNLSSSTDMEHREKNVAYVEEIIVNQDGSETVQRFDANHVDQRMVAPTQPEKRQRGLSGVEKQELDRLEDDFEQGRITATEYYLRRNAIMRATGVDDGGASFLEGTRIF